MTVIVAVSDGERVCMACDSQATNNGSKLTLATSKIVRRGPVLFGPCDGPTIGAIRYQMPEPPQSLDLEQWVRTEWLPWLRELQRGERILETDNGAEKLRCQTLIACGAVMLAVDYSGHAVRTSEPFIATGSAWCEARGAMWAAGARERVIDPEGVARVGVEAAIALDSGCGPPVRVEWTDR